jgi:hypothetical protein
MGRLDWQNGFRSLAGGHIDFSHPAEFLAWPAGYILVI